MIMLKNEKRNTHVDLFFQVQWILESSLSQEGRNVAAYDVEYDPTYMNILDPKGYTHAIYQVLRLDNGAGLTMAPVCSSFVWVSFGSTPPNLKFGNVLQTFKNSPRNL